MRKDFLKDKSRVHISYTFEIFIWNVYHEIELG